MSLERFEQLVAHHDQWRRDHLPSDEAMALARDVQQFAAALAARGMTVRVVQLDRIPAPPPASASASASASNAHWCVATVAGEVRVLEEERKR